MHVRPHHELQELMAKLLFGIETVPAKEQRRMVNRACEEVVKWHEECVKKMRGWVKDMEINIPFDGRCPECDCKLGQFSTHKYDCSLKAMLLDTKG